MNDATENLADLLDNLKEILFLPAPYRDVEIFPVMLSKEYLPQNGYCKLPQSTSQKLWKNVKKNFPQKAVKLE